MTKLWPITIPTGYCIAEASQIFGLYTIEPFLAAIIFRELVERMDQGVEINPGQPIEDILPGLVLEISEASDESDMLTISLSQASLAD